MKKPDLNHVYETFIKTSVDDLEKGTHLKEIQNKVSPLISELKKKNIINWYSFLIHNRTSGVPTTEDDTSPYLHTRVELKKNVDPADFEKSLPDYCVMTRKASLSNVGIDKSFLKNEDDAEGWRILGEISEVILDMVNILREDIPKDDYNKNIWQFLHFWLNITQLPVPMSCPNCHANVTAKCPKCQNIFNFCWI